MAVERADSRMASETTTDATATTRRTETTGDWRAGVLAGLAGSLVMGVLITLMNPAVIAGAMAGLYGLAPPPNGVVGWVAHMSHGAVFGVVFAALVGVLGYDDSVGRSAGLGVAYGVVVWVVAAALVMPLWLQAVGFPNAPPFPNFAIPSLLWHVVYGVVLGGTYAALRNR